MGRKRIIFDYQKTNGQLSEKDGRKFQKDGGLFDGFPINNKRCGCTLHTSTPLHVSLMIENLIS